METQISTNMQLNVPHRNNCFEIFGFDVILDDDYKPWLVEVNTALSLATDAALDRKIKNEVVTELLHMLRIQCYDRKKLDERLERDKSSRLHGSKTASNTKTTSNTENTRRRDVCAGKKGALEELTEDDVKVLEEIDEEHARRGNYRRIYPQNNEQMHKWMQLFEVKRYYNILQYQWITRRNTTPARELFEQQQRALNGGAGGQTPGKRGGLRAAAAKAKALITLQRAGQSRAPVSPGSMGGGAGGRDMNDYADAAIQLLHQGMDWMEQAQLSGSSRPYNTSQSVSPPTSPGPRSTPPHGAGRDHLQQHPAAARIPHGGAMRAASQVTRAQAERQYGSALQAQAQALQILQAAHPMSTYQLSSAKGEEILSKMGRAQAWAECLRRADVSNERLPPLGSPQHQQQLLQRQPLHSSLQGQVEWIIGRERASARPPSPAGPWQVSQSHRHAIERVNGRSSSSNAIGLQGNSLRLASSRGENDKGAGSVGASTAARGNSRLERTSLGAGMMWPEVMLSAVAYASQHPKSSVRMGMRQTAGFATLHMARPHAPAHEDADLGAIIPASASGSTSAPVASPRNTKIQSQATPTAKTTIGYPGRDALEPPSAGVSGS